MKILHLISGGDVGGAKTHVLSLLHGLLSVAGITLAVFREGAFAEEARALGIPTVVISGGLRGSLHEIAALHERERFDLFHSHGSRGNLAAAMLGRRLGVPTLTTVHSDYRRDYLGRPLKALTYGTLNKWALRRIDCRVGMSRAMTELLLDRRFSPEGLFTIYSGLSFAPPPPSDRAALRKQFSLSPDDVVAGLAARLSPVKDIATALRAMAALKDTCPRLKLLVAGDGELLPQLTRLAEELGLSDRVRFAGWVRDMDAFFAAIDINLLTSLTECFPYSLLEGARHSLPTVATRVGGIPALIDHMVGGYLFTPGDVAALTRHLRALYDDPARREAMGQALFVRAARDFSMERMLDTQTDIYETILRRAARKPMERDRLIVSGAYGQGNAGDDAILEGILREIGETDPDRPVTVLSRSPKKTRKTYGVQAIHTFNAVSVWRACRRAALFISGGGNLIQNITSNRSLWYYLAVIRLARLRGARVLMYGCGVGPLRGKLSRRLTRNTLNRCVEAVTLREESSVRDLASLGVTAPRVTLSADPALGLLAAPAEQIDSFLLSQELAPEGEYIAFSLRRWPGFAEKAPVFAQAADYVRDIYGLTPVFVPVEHSDGEAARQVRALMKTPSAALSPVTSAGLSIGLLARMQAVVAMRLHALIFASGQGLPLVGVAYDEKVSAFLRHMGNPLFVPFEDVTFETLRELIDRALAGAPSQVERLEAVARLRALERRNVEVLSDMLKGEKA